MTQKGIDSNASEKNNSTPVNNNDVELKYNDKKIKREVDLVDLSKYIWSKRKVILRNSLIGCVVGLVVAFSIPKEYKTVVKLAPENNIQSSGGNMGALAAIAGVNLSSMNSDGITPLLYPDIISSTPFLLDFKDVLVKSPSGDGEITMYEYMDEYKKSPWWSMLFAIPGNAYGFIRSAFSEKSEEAKEWNAFSLTKKQMRFLDSLRDAVYVYEDKKNGALVIETFIQDPVISAQYADSIISKLQSYMIKYKTEKSRNDLKYYERLFEESKDRYYSSQQQLAKFEDANKNVVSASYAIESARLQNEVALTFGVYNSLAQQVEMAKAKVQQDTPVLTVLEPAHVPLNAIKPNKKVVLIATIFLFAFVTVVFYVFKDIFKKNA